MLGRRIRSAIALAVFALGTGAPIGDSVWYHADGGTAARHIESADNPDCHSERCTLGGPATPGVLVTGIPQAPRLEPASRSLGTPRADRPLDRTPAHAPDSRAPPA